MCASLEKEFYSMSFMLIHPPWPKQRKKIYPGSHVNSLICWCNKCAFLSDNHVILFFEKILADAYLFGQFLVLLSELQKSLQGNYEDVDDNFKALHKRMSNELAKILYCLEDLGLLCTYEVSLVLLKNTAKCVYHEKK